jgi:hypothetical protein
MKEKLERMLLETPETEASEAEQEDEDSADDNEEENEVELEREKLDDEINELDIDLELNAQTPDAEHPQTTMPEFLEALDLSSVANNNISAFALLDDENEADE